MSDTIIATRFEPDGLQLRVPEGPGLGVELNWDNVKRYSVEM
jgi:L-alanine-DL-glutamate epimerase-like enolase superfamily enzyme